MALLSLNQSAKFARKSKEQVLFALKNGQLSGIQDNETKRWQIDTSELLRVWPQSSSGTEQTSFTSGSEPIKDHHSEPSKPDEAHIKTILELVRQDRQSLLDTINDLRERLDKSQSENSKLSTMLLTHQPEPSKPVKTGSNKLLWFWISLLALLLFYSFYMNMLY